MTIKIAHFIYQFATGGLENGLVSLVNNLPADRYSHVIICLTTCDKFVGRLEANNVEIISLNLPAGPLFKHYFLFYKLIMKIKPDIVHTRNLMSIELQFVACICGVNYRIHSEHGRGMKDLSGKNFKDALLRRMLSPFVHKFIPLSQEIKDYLISTVAVNKKKIHQIYNGVNLELFKPSNIKEKGLKIITVGRMEAIKDPFTLINAFSELLNKFSNARLTIVGDGSLLNQLKSTATLLGINNYVTFLGDRTDVSEILAKNDLFVQTSLVEGISNTILEAMASGLPVIATDVGGNSELIEPGYNGFLVPPGNSNYIAKMMSYYCEDKTRCIEHGLNGRSRAEKHFSLRKMIEQYDELYSSRE